LDGNLVNQENFPLPTLGAKLRALSVDIHSGRGFHVIRGLNPDDYSVEDLTIIWLGVQSYIADQFGRQDDRGNMLGTHLHRPVFSSCFPFAFLFSCDFSSQIPTHGLAMTQCTSWQTIRLRSSLAITAIPRPPS
jgi:hypothetical protein